MLNSKTRRCPEGQRESLLSARGHRGHTPVFLPEEFHDQRSLVGFSPWACKESDTADCVHIHPSLLILLTQKLLSGSPWQAEAWGWGLCPTQHIAPRHEAGTCGPWRPASCIKTRLQRGGQSSRARPHGREREVRPRAVRPALSAGVLYRACVTRAGAVF